MPSQRPTARSSRPADILVVENDDDLLLELQQHLRGTSDLVVRGATSVIEAWERATADTPKAVVIDVGLPTPINPPRDLQAALDGLDSKEFVVHGHRLAGVLRERFPDLPIFGVSRRPTEWPQVCRDWFAQRGKTGRAIGVYDKRLERTLLRFHVHRAMNELIRLKVFIVHGHDTTHRRELVDMARRLNWDSVVLGEQERENADWFSMFERHAKDCDLAWVLYSADEWACGITNTAATPQRRPRPNVLLEHGYLLGKFGRHSRRVWLFQPKEVELPSDISGWATLRVSGPISEADPAVAKSLEPWLG